MSFPLYIFLFIYLAFILIWLIFSFVGIYHMLKFGFINFITFASVFFYIAVSVLILAVSYNFIIGVEWNSEVLIFKGLLDGADNFFK